jgi:hypothetical protein
LGSAPDIPEAASADTSQSGARRVTRNSGLADAARGARGADRAPIIQSFEPGEDWYWCYVDELTFEIAGAGPSPSHP